MKIIKIEKNSKEIYQKNIEERIYINIYINFISLHYNKKSGKSIFLYDKWN